MIFKSQLFMVHHLLLCGGIIDAVSGDSRPLKRLRNGKDIRWTFDFPGLPNDPESVQIDQELSTEDEVLVSTDGMSFRMPSTIPSQVPSPIHPMTPSPTKATVSPHVDPIVPSRKPSSTPLVCGITKDERRRLIVQQVSESMGRHVDVLSNETSPQARALEWILNERQGKTCPGKKLVQRWILATFYFSTHGEEWFQCRSLDDGPTDQCGLESPFVGKDRFLSEVNECVWAGITCDMDLCVTEIEFEFNNLVGTIPTEIGLLDHLELLGMERGGLHGTIPSEIGSLSKLYFLDMDFNQLSGSLPSEMFSLSLLEQLDLNNNRLTGSIDGIGGAFLNMTFMQLHINDFTGTIPESIGEFLNLDTFSIHNAEITGTMPSSICQLVSTGTLESLSADCLGPSPDIVCSCCNCRKG